MHVTAKRLGHSERLTAEQTHDLIPYQRKDHDLVGEHEVLHGRLPDGRPFVTHLVGGHAADPDSIRPFSVNQRPTVAGLAVRAADTGRVLMLQRALNDDDPASGKWEFPGGHLEDGEDLHEAARREWTEEVGHRLPPGKHVGQWVGSNGIYQGFVHEIPSEDDVDLKKRNHKGNPDGDNFQAVAWIDPDHIYYHNLRDEILNDSGRIRPLLSSQWRGTDGQEQQQSS